MSRAAVLLTRLEEVGGCSRSGAPEDWLLAPTKLRPLVCRLLDRVTAFKSALFGLNGPARDLGLHLLRRGGSVAALTHLKSSGVHLES